MCLHRCLDLFNDLLAWRSQTQLMYGVLPNILYKDAVEQDEDLFEDWSPWPLLGNDGSVAALLSMMSNGKVCLLVSYI